MIRFEFQKPNWKYPLVDGQRRNYRIEKRPLPCDFAEKELFLPAKAYTYPGKFKAHPWQVEPINASYYHKTVCLAGPVQMGKTMIAEIGAYWGMAKLGIDGMLGFATDEKAEEMFTTRYAEMIKCKENIYLNEIWDKREDSLTKNKLRLKTCTWTSASANSKNSFASTTAPFTIGSEVAKWQKRGYDAVQMLRGRADSAFGLYDSQKMILESSPFEEGDMLHQQFFREGSVILQPHYKCSHCGKWQTLTDSQIIVRDEAFKHRPARIRQFKEEAVFYQCFFCGEEITEAQRVQMSKKPVWAMVEIENDYFKQDSEEIHDDGLIDNRLEGGVRSGYDNHCYWWNRLSDINFPYWECCARMFDSLGDDARRRTYENETMARWWKRKTGKMTAKFFDSRKIEYWQWGEQHKIPDNVLVITLGVDSQDNGFYYSFVGWTGWGGWVVLRQAFIDCPKMDKGYEYVVFDKFMGNLYAQPLLWNDGTRADFTIGCMDRGGHRPDDVDYICKHFPKGRLHGCVGLTKRYPDRELVYKSDKGPFYLGQSDALSEECGKYLSGENFSLPDDVEKEFTKQIARQFHQKKTDSQGRVSTEWIHAHLGADHYRDTLNLNLAAGMIKKVPTILMNPQHCITLRQQRLRHIQSEIAQEPKKQLQRNRTPSTNYRPNSYYNTLGGRLR